MPPRIVTLTVNPALDVAMEAGEIRPGHKVRTHGVVYDPGGGGINISRVIRALGGESLAIVVIGGHTGSFVEEMLLGSGVACRPVRVSATTRISLTVHVTPSGAEYKFVPESGELKPSDAERVLATLADVQADWLIASGSLPAGFPPDFYADVARLACRRNFRFVLDTSGAALVAARGKGIHLLKASLGEFQSLTGSRSADRDILVREASQLAASGAATMIALTLGEQGAILASADRSVILPALTVPVQSTVGAGDSFLAGLVLGLARAQPLGEALRLAIATGAAAVMGKGTARVTRQHVDALLAGRQIADSQLEAVPVSG